MTVEGNKIEGADFCYNSPGKTKSREHSLLTGERTSRPSQRDMSSILEAWTCTDALGASDSDL
jgi:hypothetical protein